MKTDLTRMLGIEHPIVLAGMGGTSVPAMVIAVSNAGGLGILGAGTNPPEMVREQIREIRRYTDRPFGLNAPLAFPNGKENVQVAIEEKVPVINYSMGRGDWIADAVHHYGGHVIASVTTLKLGLSAVRQGADAVIASGFEGAAHSGETAMFVLLHHLARKLPVPVIAAGGCSTGAQLSAVLALGGSGVSMGTRFAVSSESPWHDNFKSLALRCEISDTIRSDKFDGIPLRRLANDYARGLLKTRLNPFTAFLNSFEIARSLDIPYHQLLAQVVTAGPRRTVGYMRMAGMMKELKYSLAGDVARSTVGGGQSVGLVHAVAPVTEIVVQIIGEADQAMSKNQPGSLAGLLSVRYPVLYSGASIGMDASMPQLVAAISNAGGLGILPTDQLDPQVFRQTVVAISEQTTKPFGIALDLARRDAPQLLEIAGELKIPVIIYRGNGAGLDKHVSQSGSITIAAVHTVEEALVAQSHGASAVMACGYEGAGPVSETGTFVLVPRLVEVLDIPVIACGGVVDANSYKAALSLGAQGCAITTRFAMSHESPWPESVKQQALTQTLALGADDTFLLEIGQAEAKNSIIGRRCARGLFESETNTPLPCGQSIALIDDCLPVAILIRQIVGEAEQDFSENRDH